MIKSNLSGIMRQKGIRFRELVDLTGHETRDQEGNVTKEKVSSATISKACKDKGILTVRLGKLQVIAQALGCQVKELFEEG